MLSHISSAALKSSKTPTGLPPGGPVLSAITPHTLRKAVAMPIDQAGLNELAAELLGHASKEVTEMFYFQPTKRVNPVTAILERLATDGGGSALGSAELVGDGA